MTTEYSAIQASRTPETDVGVISVFYTGSAAQGASNNSKTVRARYSY